MIGRSYGSPRRDGNTSNLGETGGATRDSIPGMRFGARTPEELETLLEDAFVVRDRAAVVDLFEPDGLLAACAMATARGAAIGACVADLWAQDLTYVARPERILQASDTGLIVAERAISVVRRRHDHWRYAISLLHTEPKSNGDTPP